jgi:hypothetical protein
MPYHLTPQPNLSDAGRHEWRPLQESFNFPARPETKSGDVWAKQCRSLDVHSRPWRRDTTADVGLRCDRFHPERGIAVGTRRPERGYTPDIRKKS